jgi:flagellar export protein FliJ
MKTRFSQILKVKKRRVDECERELLDIRNVKKNKLLQINNISKEIENFKKPASGNIMQLNLSFSLLSQLNNQKKSYKSDINILDAQIEGLKELYKEANIEFEKIKYLDSIEIKKILSIEAEKEKKDMDEISNILFSRKLGEAV